MEIRGGCGFDRQKLQLEGGAARELLAWLLSRREPAGKEALAKSLVQRLEVSLGEASSLLSLLVAAGVLEEVERASKWARRIQAWSEIGWDDAANFHYSTWGQKFEPNSVGDLDYDDYYRDLLEDPEGGPQPPAAPPPHPEDLAVKAGTYEASRVTFREVVEGAIPINRFRTSSIESEELEQILEDACKCQHVVMGALGEHLFKAYPSGGARHPLEVYVFAKSVRGLPRGVYHYHSVDGTLCLVREEQRAMAVDENCFHKGGIETAAAVLLITCRWLRHSWKYRYPRSYRMVLLELGHLIQTVHLTARSRGLGAYHCPSIHDDGFRRLLDLDGGRESPMYAIGIGKDGAR